MDNPIVWKEAKSHQESDDCEDDGEDDYDHKDDYNLQGSTAHPHDTDTLNQPIDDGEHATGCDREFRPDIETDDVPTSNLQPRVASNTFSHHHVNLKLIRNITALADQAQHQPKLEFTQHSQPFHKWAETALIAISPSADIILFSGRSPERLVFMAKLRMEPINQYTTKPLEIALDFDEHITSLLCLPIMSTQRTALGSVDWTALVVGLSSGYVKFYTDQSTCLLSLKFYDEPVTCLKLQTQKTNSNARSQIHFASIVDELLISYKTCAIVTDGIGLLENLRIAKDDVVKSQFSYEPAYSAANLPTILTCQRWTFQESKFHGSRVMDADLLGMRSTTKFDALKSDSMNSEHVPVKSLTRTLVLVGQGPFLSCQREARETTTHSYTEMIGSLLPFWNKPQPSRVQINDINCSTSSNSYDKDRLATSIIPSPDRRLAVVTDDFGRVMLLDATNWLVVRMWKGYRNAQCGWVEVKRNPEERATPYASFLTIYAPKRGLLEVWSTQRGPRVAAFNVGKGCRLLYTGHKMLNMRAESAQKGKSSVNLLVDQSYSSNSYLLNAKSETVFSIELPYTYSLYKYGDLKSRDRLLINELVNLLQQVSELGLVSETLHRMSLAESLEIAIQKVAQLLQPAMIITIMENLIIRIMKNYDNHSGETMSLDDQSIVELCKRLIRLCSMFNNLSQSAPSDMHLPDVTRRLIDEYEEHPREIDEFAEHLGWTATEVLRYLSLLALERSYRRDHIQNPWPSLGEPLAWSEFIGCFDLNRLNFRSSKTKPQAVEFTDKISIKLVESNGQKVVADEGVLKTALFMYNRLSESFHKATSNSTTWLIADGFSETIGDNYTYLEPSSRLVLLFQFWLSTRLCNHWKMWAFLQQQIGQISDELKVIVMTHDSDDLLIETWKRIYQMILESDNTYAAMIATAAIRSDTIRMISDNEKREKLERSMAKGEARGKLLSEPDTEDSDQKSSTSIDWECLCVDAERMSIVSQQLEDVFLLNLLLKYSLREGHLWDKFVYRVPRISVANILRGGPSIVSELVAQWVAQANVHPKLFTQPYGHTSDDDEVSGSRVIGASKDRSGLFSTPRSTSNNDEQAKELLHHTKTSFPHSLEPNVVLLNCVWEFCQRWATCQSATAKEQYLNKTLDCISLLTSEVAGTPLKHNAACLAYKTFFQRTFERLTALIETNPIILSPKCSRSREALARRELNLSAECLDDFVQFCFKLSDFMLETSHQNSVEATGQEDNAEEAHKQREKLVALDDWWSSTAATSARRHLDQVATMTSSSLSCELRDMQSMGADTAPGANENRLSLVRTAVASHLKLFDINTLIELNRLTALMMLIFKLKLIKCYPLSLIGEESRQALQLDLQQSPAHGADIKTRRGFLNELRQSFSRKCIVSIVAKLTEETNVFDGPDDKIDGNTSGGGGIFGRDSQRDDHGQIERTSTKDVSVATASREDIDTNDKQRMLCLSVSGSDAATSGRGRKSRAVKAAGSSDEASGKQQQQQQQEQIVASKDGGRQIISHDHHRVAWPTEAALSATAGGQFSSQEVAGAASHRQRAGSAGESSKANDPNDFDDDDDDDAVDSHGAHNLMTSGSSENNESMILFTHLLSLAREWQFNTDELHLELVFELFRCNHDKLASQLSNRIQDKQTLANGLLKISSQRVLVLFGLSVRLCKAQQWRQRVDKWSLFQPNVSSWLQAIQDEEIKHELAELMFQDTLKPGNMPTAIKRGAEKMPAPTFENFHAFLECSLGLRLFVLNGLRQRTKLILETVTNYLDDGSQANRLAYDMLQVLESDQLFEKFLAKERKLWSKVDSAGLLAPTGETADETGQ